MAFRIFTLDQFVGLHERAASQEEPPAGTPQGALRECVNMRSTPARTLASRLGVRQGLIIDPADVRAATGLTGAADVRMISVRGFGELILPNGGAPLGADRALMLWGLFELDGERRSIMILAPDLNVLPRTTTQELLLTSAADALLPVPPGDDPLTDYVRTARYRHTLLVACPFGGDLSVRDIWRRDPLTCEEVPHRIEAEPNALARFDIQSVLVEYEPQNTGGVRAPMALFGLRLPEAPGRPPNDGFRDQMHSAIRTDDFGNAVADTKDFMVAGGASTLLTFAHFQTENTNNSDQNTYNGYSYYTDVIVRPGSYVFSNYSGDGTYPNILGTPEFPESPGTETGRGADVYRWDEFELDYYPCSGTERSGRTMRAEIDREYDRLSSGLPRVLELEPPHRRAPETGWQYVFVWETARGDRTVTGAPSAPLAVADTLFSAVRDEDFPADGYHRFAGMDPEDERRMAEPPPPGNYGAPEQATGLPPVWDAGGTLTRFGELLRRLKAAVYRDDHRYGPQGDPDVPVATTEERGRLSCVATVFHEGGDLMLGGFLAETAKVNAGPVRLFQPRIIVPVTQGTENFTYNAVFDNEGKYRAAWRRGDAPRHQLIFRGYNGFIDGPLGYAHGVVRDVYYNLVCDPADENNEPSSVRDLARAPTVMRLAQREDERLGHVRDEVEPQAAARLILPGMAAVELTAGQDIHVETEFLITTDFPPEVIYFLARDAERTAKPLATATEGTGRITRADALRADLVLALEGERFLGPEQLTAHVPASVLFGAPRVTLSIAAVPPDAVGLRIYRTRSSLAASYSPHDYGLVSTVPVERYSQAEALALGDPDLAGKVKDGALTFFDDVPDDDLDFSADPAELDGLDTPLASTFVQPLNERVYYANYRETYRPAAPRTEGP